MEKPFEVGEWVWVWPQMAWGRLQAQGEFAMEQGQYPVNFNTWVGWYYPSQFTRNPVIPPKPKKMVTKEVGQWFGIDNVKRLQGMSPVGFDVPLGATNIRCLYDIEE